MAKKWYTEKSVSIKTAKTLENTGLEMLKQDENILKKSLI